MWWACLPWEAIFSLSLGCRSPCRYQHSTPLTVSNHPGSSASNCSLIRAPLGAAECPALWPGVIDIPWTIIPGWGPLRAPHGPHLAHQLLTHLWEAQLGEDLIFTQVMHFISVIFIKTGRLLTIQLYLPIAECSLSVVTLSVHSQMFILSFSLGHHSLSSECPGRPDSSPRWRRLNDVLLYVLWGRSWSFPDGLWLSIILTFILLSSC